MNCPVCGHELVKQLNIRHHDYPTYICSEIRIDDKEHYGIHYEKHHDYYSNGKEFRSQYKEVIQLGKFKVNNFYKDDGTSQSFIEAFNSGPDDWHMDYWEVILELPQAFPFTDRNSFDNKIKTYLVFS